MLNKKGCYIFEFLNLNLKFPANYNSYNRQIKPAELRDQEVWNFTPFGSAQLVWFVSCVRPTPEQVQILVSGIKMKIERKSIFQEVAVVQKITPSNPEFVKSVVSELKKVIATKVDLRYVKTLSSF